GLRKILELAEHVEDGIERAHVLDQVDRVFVLYFSPKYSVAFLETLAAGKVPAFRERVELRERLGDTREPVHRALRGIDELVRRYGATLTLEQREALNHIGFGKLSIRRALEELLDASETNVSDEARQ